MHPMYEISDFYTFTLYYSLIWKKITIKTKGIVRIHIKINSKIQIAEMIILYFINCSMLSCMLLFRTEYVEMTSLCLFVFLVLIFFLAWFFSLFTCIYSF